jgi:hypothetical protein
VVQEAEVGLCVEKQMESSEMISERHGSYMKQGAECLYSASGRR